MPEIQFDALRIKYAEYLKRGNHCRVIMTYCASITQIKFKWNKAYFLLHYFLSSLNITFFSFFLSQFHYSLSFFLDLFLRFLFFFFSIFLVWPTSHTQHDRWFYFCFPDGYQLDKGSLRHQSVQVLVHLYNQKWNSSTNTSTKNSEYFYSHYSL